MSAAATVPLSQHNVEIQRNRAVWARKPLLQETYRDFYRQIAVRIDPGIPGLIVELGSGMGSIKDVISQCITTDVFPNPWLDRQENAYRLSFAPGSISHLILFDVWHHLRYPGNALREFHRVLAPGGRLILFEPAASWFGKLVYQVFHHEPVGMADFIEWDAPVGFSADDAGYFAAQGSATRLFWWGEAKNRLDGWQLKELPITSFAYLATGGFSGPQIGGRAVYRLMSQLDRAATHFPRALATRLLIVLEKEKA